MNNGKKNIYQGTFNKTDAECTNLYSSAQILLKFQILLGTCLVIQPQQEDLVRVKKVCGSNLAKVKMNEIDMNGGIALAIC